VRERLVEIRGQAVYEIVVVGVSGQRRRRRRAAEGRARSRRRDRVRAAALALALAARVVEEGAADVGDGGGAGQRQGAALRGGRVGWGSGRAAAGRVLRRK
jgi:hypothetical protein